MNRLRVDLKESSYEIIVGKNILSELGKLITEVGDFSKIAIITDNNVGNLYLDAVRGSLLKKGFSVCDIEISVLIAIFFCNVLYFTWRNRSFNLSSISKRSYISCSYDQLFSYFIASVSIISTALLYHYLISTIIA